MCTRWKISGQLRWSLVANALSRCLRLTHPRHAILEYLPRRPPLRAVALVTPLLVVEAQSRIQILLQHQQRAVELLPQRHADELLLLRAVERSQKPLVNVHPDDHHRLLVLDPNVPLGERQDSPATRPQLTQGLAQPGPPARHQLQLDRRRGHDGQTVQWKTRKCKTEGVVRLRTLRRGAWCVVRDGARPGLGLAGCGWLPPAYEQHQSDRQACLAHPEDKHPLDEIGVRFAISSLRSALDSTIS